uniref:Uncharacterized protein n=1 Tax=Nelumbo nucifera TaxID=4432 RepID=A0A822YWN0_NELNU|nr:TPA_asm: hypothetical protein HUJ06_007743 [Nelumbo nucifera]
MVRRLEGSFTVSFLLSSDFLTRKPSLFQGYRRLPVRFFFLH